MALDYSKDNIDSKIQDSIISFLKEKKKSSFGDMVKNIKASYNEVLKNVIILKRKGIIDKIKEPEGYYQIINHQNK